MRQQCASVSLHLDLGPLQLQKACSAFAGLCSETYCIYLTPVPNFCCCCQASAKLLTFAPNCCYFVHPSRALHLLKFARTFAVFCVRACCIC